MAASLFHRGHGTQCGERCCQDGIIMLFSAAQLPKPTRHLSHACRRSSKPRQGGLTTCSPGEIFDVVLFIKNYSPLSNFLVGTASFFGFYGIGFCVMMAA